METCALYWERTRHPRAGPAALPEPILLISVCFADTFPRHLIFLLCVFVRFLVPIFSCP